MYIKTIVFTLVTFAHDLFTIIWVGGLIITVISYIPAIKEALGPGPQVKKVMMAFQKRHSTWVYVSMLGLALTGLLISKQNPDYYQLFGFNNTFSVALSIKHLLVLFTISITLYRTLVLGRPQKPISPKTERLNLTLLIVNVVLALAVLLNSALITVIAKTVAG